MKWDERSWNRHLGKARSALMKRDVLARTRNGPSQGPAGHGEVVRQRKAWAAKARANLRRLSVLARQAPDRCRAERTVRELLHWYERPMG